LETEERLPQETNALDDTTFSKLEEAVDKIQQEWLRISVAGTTFGQAIDGLASPEVGWARNIESACHYQHSQHCCGVFYIEVDRPVLNPLPQNYHSFRQSRIRGESDQVSTCVIEWKDDFKNTTQIVATLTYVSTTKYYACSTYFL